MKYESHAEWCEFLASIDMLDDEHRPCLPSWEFPSVINSSGIFPLGTA